ncbi:rhomboid domain-containing protein 2 [Amia ocellicauda]|uniref:rhomboid domain-containing protein 2 n=1 Tax=Amia ocellicauda TaxID=2972642 RepID=UPI003464C8CB
MDPTKLLRQCLHRAREVLPAGELTSGAALAVAISAAVYIATARFSVAPEVLSLGPGALADWHVHKLVTYSFCHTDPWLLLLQAGALCLFGCGLERSVGTARFCCLLLLLSGWTGFLHALLELLLFGRAGGGSVRGLLPVTLAMVGMATVRSRIRRALLCGVNVPRAALPWLFLLASLLVPGASFLCNLVAVLVGQAYGVGRCFLLDVSETRACVLDKTVPFRLLRRLGVAVYVPASVQERRTALHKPLTPAAGSYPVQVYAPVSAIPPQQSLSQSYEGWQNSPYSPGSYFPPAPHHAHGHGHTVHQNTGSQPGHGGCCGHAHSSPSAPTPGHHGSYSFPSVQPGGPVHFSGGPSLAPSLVNAGAHVGPPSVGMAGVSWPGQTVHSPAGLVVK